MDINKVLFISQEISPYLPETEMATTSRMLAQGVQGKGIEVRTFMPKYGFINERRNQLHEVIRLSGMNLIIDDTDHPLIIKVATLQPSRMSVYFIYNEDYFTPNITKDLEINSMPDDNDERSIFYVRGVLEAVKKQLWIPAIINCSGWLTALAPLYIKKFFNEATLEDIAEKLKYDGFTDEELAPILGKEATYEDLMKLAVDNSDGVIQCSPKISSKVMKIVEDSKLPFLKYKKGEYSQFVDRCMEFYHSL